LEKTKILIKERDKIQMLGKHAQATLESCIFNIQMLLSQLCQPGPHSRLKEARLKCSVIIIKA